MAVSTIDELDEMLAPYAGLKGATIPMLQKVQENLGYVSPEAVKRIAKIARVSESEVFGVATFYAQFRFVPRGKHTVKVCLGTACHVKGAQRILEIVEDELGVKEGGTTEDMEYTLESVACFGSCGLSPVVLVDQDFHGRQTVSTIKQVIKKGKDGK